jgi:ABC-type multidrug transport system fused ATPase/permease subunit
MKTKFNLLDSSYLPLLRRLWSHVSERRRYQLLFLVILMVIVSFMEIVSIGLVLPFLGALTAPEIIFNSVYVSPFIKLAGIEKPSEILLPLTIIFISSTLVTGLFRIFLLFLNTRVSFLAGADFGLDIYRKTLYQPYSIHCSRNSSEIIAGITNKANSIIYSVLLPFLNILSSSFLLIAIIGLLVFLYPFVAMISIIIIGSIYGLIIYFNHKKLKENSHKIAEDTTFLIKSLQEGLGGIRDTLISSNQEIYCNIYQKADSSLRVAQASSLFIAGCPRFIVESFGMIVIACLAYSTTRNNFTLSELIPTLGIMAYAAQKLLPVLQLAYGSWSAIQSSFASLEDILKLLDQKLPKFANKNKIKPLNFKKNIALRNVYFKYSTNSSYALKNINFEIKRGSRLGVIGKTGSGKSTFLDLVLGLLVPTKGSMYIDNKLLRPNNQHSWSLNIANVPQTIFLTDGTIEENIAFGLPRNKIDLELVKSAARQAMLAEDIESWPLQYNTLVGERGVRLSGGQRQRIGIARALYKQAKIIIFDEATSALDYKTEESVMSTIHNLSHDLTVIIVAHRLSSLRICSEIVEIKNGEITKRKPSQKK